MKKEQLKIREQALLSAALNCFATERCEDVTVARIAKLAGVAKGTVYLHFKSKDEICARLAQDFYARLAEKYDNITGSATEQIELLISVSLMHYHEQSHYRHVVQYCHREHFLNTINQELAQSLRNIGTLRHHKMTIAVEQGIAEGLFSSDAKSKLISICLTIEGALYSFGSGTITERISQMELIHSITRYILSSIGQQARLPMATSTSSTAPEPIPEV